MQSSFDMTTLIFLGLAVFVAWKLRSVLGQKNGSEQPPADPFRRQGQNRDAQPDLRVVDTPKNDSNVIPLPGAANDRNAGENGQASTPANRWEGLSAPIAAGLAAIAAKEPDFDHKVFLDASKRAYEYIVTAFANGDRKALKPLLAKDVYDGFDVAMSEREKRGEKAETTFVSIDKAELANVTNAAGAAQITVRFASKLISATRDGAGAVVEGDPGVVADVTDVWTFARQLGAGDPNWILVATEAVA